MELEKLKMDEIRGYEPNRIEQVIGEARTKLLEMRMDVYAATKKNHSQARQLRRTVARALTVQNERQRKQTLLAARDTKKVVAKGKN